MTPMRRRLLLLPLAVVLMVGCSDDGGSQKAAVTVAETDAPTTTRASTTTSSTIAATTTTSTIAATTTTSTIPASTTTETLPIPAPSPDPGVVEPVNQIGSIEIPSLDVTKPMFEGVTIPTLNQGPGHWPGTALPGHLGNVVIGGHRTSHDHPFRHVDQLKAGDQVILTTAEGRFIYQVTSIEIVNPDAIWIIDQTNAYTATLFACHPAGSTRQRIVVHLALQP